MTLRGARMLAAAKSQTPKSQRFEASVPYNTFFDSAPADVLANIFSHLTTAEKVRLLLLTKHCAHVIKTEPTLWNTTHLPFVDVVNIASLIRLSAPFVKHYIFENAMLYSASLLKLNKVGVPFPVLQTVEFQRCDNSFVQTHGNYNFNHNFLKTNAYALKAFAPNFQTIIADSEFLFLFDDPEKVIGIPKELKVSRITIGSVDASCTDLALQFIRKQKILYVRDAITTGNSVQFIVEALKNGASHLCTSYTNLSNMQHFADELESLRVSLIESPHIFPTNFKPSRLKNLSMVRGYPSQYFYENLPLTIEYLDLHSTIVEPSTSFSRFIEKSKNLKMLIMRQCFPNSVRAMTRCLNDAEVKLENLWVLNTFAEYDVLHELNRIAERGCRVYLSLKFLIDPFDHRHKNITLVDDNLKPPLFPV